MKAKRIRAEIAQLQGEMAQIFNVNPSALIKGVKSKPRQNAH
jgi:DNA-binding XRE family transcriptional regulator